MAARFPRGTKRLRSINRWSKASVWPTSRRSSRATGDDDIGHKPTVGSRIRIIGKGLFVYPTFT